MTEKETALSRALHYLSWRSRTKAEVVLHLREKDYTEKEITEALQRLSEYGYVNDEEYIKRVTETIRLHPGKGKHTIKQRVRNKGIEDQLVSQFIENYDEKVDEEKAINLAKKLIERSSSLPWKKIQEKISRQLMSKGFSQEVIQKTFLELDKSSDIIQLYDERHEERKEKALSEAVKLYHKWIKKEKDRRIIRSKLMQSLYQKGYSTELIQQAINSVMQED